MKFDGKTILVIGASSGIGKASAEMLASRGARVIIAARRVAECEQIASAIKSEGGQASAIAMDIANAGSIGGAFEEIAKFGRLDGAFNNAGTTGGFSDLEMASVEEVDIALDVNARGTILCMQQEIALMRRQGGGAIVNTGSVAGVLGFSQIAAYVAAKHAVVGVTKAAAIENGPYGIRINCINPGGVRTDMVDRAIAHNPAVEQRAVRLHPIGRLGEPNELAEAACWLLSDASSFVTGAVLAVDGGQSAGVVS